MQNKWIEIARTGTFKDSLGRDQTFSSADLEAIALAYDPKKREAPLVIGHPKTNSPAFGWVESLKCEKDKLLASLAQLTGQVKELVANKHYKHVSMSLMPDKITLRHVGLLGAAQPAIDGLAAVELAAEDNIYLEFINETEPNNPNELNDLKEKAVEALKKEIAELQEKLKVLQAENARLKLNSEKEGTAKAEAEKRATELAAEFSAYKAELVKTNRESRILALIDAGKIRPCDKEDKLSFATALAEVSSPVNFSTSDGVVQISAEERYFRELEARPMDAALFNFSNLPEHAKQSHNPAQVNAQDITQKL